MKIFMDTEQGVHEITYSEALRILDSYYYEAEATFAEFLEEHIGSSIPCGFCDLIIEED